MSAPIQNRYEFVYLFDVENGNPNGDPDAGNMPRLDPETSLGLVTDVCLKRKIRNYVQLITEEKQGYRIYVKEKAVLSQVRGDAYATEDVKALGKDKGEQIKAAADFMCKNFFDVRTFGAVMSTKENNCGQVRGPVQLNFARSLDPIVPQEITITRMAVETAKEAESQGGDNRTMGRKHIVPYGLYRAEGYISAPLAEKTGFNDEDADMLWKALANMFDHDHSAARGKMAARRLIVFKHEGRMGNAPAHNLFELVSVSRADGSDRPPRSFEDYQVNIDRSAVPAGVSLEEMI
ncbi:MAG: type I-C CRISPR-associated protein Cas7/Csd2 [Deltaproteobacteria bacterium]|nr:type I-C CRISPR-associated protein Cas7/Csd2 [Deltaproteobacteria bacterium]